MSIRFQMIAPDGLLNEKAMRNVIRARMKVLGRALQRDFEDTTATWEHKPDFRLRTQVDSRSNQIGFGVVTEDEIYALVNAGARPHVIPSVPPPVAPMPIARYQAKSKPGSLQAFSGGRDSEPEYFGFWRVPHPGFKARMFDERMREKWEDVLEVALNDLMEELARESGYAR